MEETFDDLNLEGRRTSLASPEATKGGRGRVEPDAAIAKEVIVDKGHKGSPLPIRRGRKGLLSNGRRG